MSKPLEGIKVVDLTTFLATPTTGRALGEWGADVIKIEAAKGDPGRVNQAVVFGMTADDDENLGFDMANMHKRFISLNLKSEKGLEVMHKLLAEADVFITNMRAKSLAKMGLDWESLHARYPRLVMGHGLGYGKKGPEKDNAGFDVTCYMGRGGVFGTTVNKGDAPMIPTNGYGDFQASISSHPASSPPLSVATRPVPVITSPAPWSMLRFTRSLPAWFPRNTAISIRRAVARSNNPLNNVFHSKDDKWVVLCLPEYNRDWPRVMELIHREDLAEHPDYSDVQAVNSKGLAGEVTDILDEGFAQFTRDELLDMFGKNDMPCEPAQTPLDVYEDQNALVNEYIKQVPYPKGGRWCPTVPVQFELNETAELEPTGMMGSSTEAVMVELGYAKEEIDAAMADGSVCGPVKLAVLQGK